MNLAGRLVFQPAAEKRGNVLESQLKIETCSKSVSGQDDEDSVGIRDTSGEPEGVRLVLGGLRDLGDDLETGQRP